MEERDVSSEMQRPEMEKLSADTFSRVERTLRNALHNSSEFGLTVQMWSDSRLPTTPHYGRVFAPESNGLAR